MKILVLGANGAVGQLAIDELLKANHEVKALVRNASTLSKKHPRLTVEQGDPTNAANLEWLLAGQDAVLSTLGARKNKRTTLRFDVATSLLAVMKKHGVRKLVWLDGAGVGSSKEFMQRSSFLFGRIVMPLFLNHMYADAAVADELIERSGCDWGDRASDVVHQPREDRERLGRHRHEPHCPAALKDRARTSRRFWSNKWLRTITSGRCPSSSLDTADSAAGIRESSGRDRCNIRARRV